MCGCSLGVPACHVLLLGLWISKIWGWLRQETVFPRLIHVCRVVPWHGWRCQIHAVGLYHWVISWKCICRKGLWCCIWSKASLRSSVMDFGVGSLSWEMCGCGVSWGVGVGSEIFCVWLLVWKARPSGVGVVSMLMEVPVFGINLDRQSAALFFAPDIHSKVML